MTKQIILSLVDQYLLAGGAITRCPTRTCYGGESRQRRTGDLV